MNSNKRYQNIELLAPAGSMETFQAVIHAGADAVYLGGGRFGARAYANNFTEEELLLAIDYAHIHGRKVYLTVNTLFKERELTEELYSYLLPYYEQGLDAKFKKKSYKKMKELITDSKRTVIIVSHSSDTIRKLCNTVLWLHDGNIKMQGSVDEVLPLYEEFMS